MDSNGTSSAKVDQKVTNGVASVLTYAACEWFLIFLMFIDALLSYLLVWFARYCRLQLPCFLCSKLHHRFQWRSLLCSRHRSEVSSLISCQIHDNNLADCRGMCDDCLLSFTKKATPDMHRLLLGKLGFDLLLRGDFAQPRPCSCCDKPWRTRHNSQRLLQLGFPGRTASSKPNIPVPRRGSRHGSLKKMRDNRKNGTGTSYGDGMAHVGYTELKITSDAEAEFPFSDEDGFVSMNESTIQSPSQKLFQDKIFNHKQPDLQDNHNKNTPVKDDNTVEASMPELIRLDDIPLQSVRAHEDTTSLGQLVSLVDGCPPLSTGIQEDIAGTGFEKQNNTIASDKSTKPERTLNINSVEATSARDEQTNNSPSGELSCKNQNHVHASENASDPSVKVGSGEAVVDQKVSDSTTQEHVPGFVAKEHATKEELGFNEDLEQVTLHKVSGSSAKDGFKKEDGGNADLEPLTLHKVSSSAAKDGFNEDGANADLEPSALQNVSDSAAKTHAGKEENGLTEDLEPSTLHKVSGSAAKEHSSKEENGFKEDPEPLTSQHIPNEESSKTHGDEESSKAMEAQSNSNVTPKHKHPASVESFDLSIHSEIDGENLVDQLKQQVEQDKKCLRDLLKELEEERNASAIAADEAMAMITRLQEEKAALHMEALHYLRMMDEQAECDVDALEKANDLLAEREKEIQDLEMELEYYRLKCLDESIQETICKGNFDHKGMTISSTTDKAMLKASNDTKGTQKPSFSSSSPLGIEKEKGYISECLGNLEKKLYQFTGGRLSECAENGSSHHREVLINDGSLETQRSSPLRHEDDPPIFNGESPNEDAVNYHANKSHSVSAETHCNKDKDKLITFENEISDLKGRLETLKADRDFLEHSFSTLDKGKEGLQLIQEIAHQLQELRNLGIRRR